MEVIPGVKAKAVKTDAAEVAALQAKIALGKITEAEEAERRRAAIRNEVITRINENDGPILITEEMADLGIADEMRELVFQGSLAQPFRAFLSDDDDFVANDDFEFS